VTNATKLQFYDDFTISEEIFCEIS